MQNVDEKNKILLGDLNADCSYYDTPPSHFLDWNWIIRDDEDTTSSLTNCAYDRIIVTQNVNTLVSNYGIYTEGIDKEVSDHYLVWVEIKI